MGFNSGFKGLNLHKNHVCAMFQTAQDVVLTLERHLCQNCGGNKRTVFIPRQTVSSQNLEPRTNIKFCAKLGRSASETSAVLSEAHGTEAVKKFSGINC